MRITINESQAETIKSKSKYMLPPFVYERARNHTTPLGDNPIFKPEGEIPMDYMLLKERYREVVDNLLPYGEELLDVKAARKRYCELYSECAEIEGAHKEQLENLVENAVGRMFDIPIEVVNIECELTSDVKPEHSVNVRPEPVDHKSFRFRDTDDIEDMSMAVMKRRFLDCLIVGGSVAMSNDEAFYLRELYDIDGSLIPIYRELDAIYNYLLFNVQPKINDRDPHLNGYVETILGREGEKTRIHSQGHMFPILLHETIKGLMELFIAKGLPDDGRRAQMIVRQADYLLAEPWDMRMGVKLWEKYVEGVDDTSLFPYYLSETSMLTTDEFVKTMRELLADTEAGEDRKRDLLSTSAMKKGDNSSSAKVRMKDTSKNILSDGYINGEVAECELKQGSALFSGGNV